MHYNCLEYLLKWKGYDESHNQWEEHMQLHAKSKIAQFHCKYPGAACHINVALFDSIPFTRADLATSWRSSRVVTPHFEGGVMGNVRSIRFLTSSLFFNSPPVRMYSPHTSVPSPGTTPQKPMTFIFKVRRLSRSKSRRLSPPSSTCTSTTSDVPRTP
jgi:hypothetical protein